MTPTRWHPHWRRGGAGDSELLKRLLPILLPIVLAYIGKRLSPSGAATPEMSLGSILGSVLGGKGSKSRVLGEILGGLALYAADGPAWSTHTETDTPPPPDAAAEQPAPSETAQPVDEGAPQPAAAAVTEQKPAPEPAVQTYTVVSGDTLWAVAERFYGDGSKCQMIADASGIGNPDLIYPGQVRTIP
ncbi:hypothetical protein B8W66_07930 [Mycobacterium decipiens]|uniref:LysM domain-containing protein n=1 Tax=Mycobacterium decipiens TaxID=1430326 RepID=A0A1X2LWU9_9MYCO|nr:hypothetical protein B8W66_07930 [Mycobacterium decipiens]